MRSYYCALETYPEDAFVQLIGDSAVKGLILGDRFCQKRMFPDGLAQEIVFMKQAMESGKELLYQTPLYVTTRNWDTVLSIVKLISGASARIITTDMGVAAAVHRTYPHIPLIFGMLGRDRTRHYSADWLAALRNAGFSAMETDDPALMRTLLESGVQPCPVYGFLRYRTLGRVCYLRYQTGLCDRDACLRDLWELRAEDGTDSLPIHGYMLGAQYRYRDRVLLEPFLTADSTPFSIYARDIADLKQRLFQWNAGEAGTG